MTISFSEIVDVSKIQELHDSIYKSFGILTAILDPDGTVLVSSGWNKICTEFHRKHPESAARCRESDIALAKPLGKNEKYKSYKCLNGLIDVAMPIYIEGEHIATLFTGQFFFEDPDVDFFRSQARMFGYDEKKYLNALQDVPVITRDKLDIHMSYLANHAILLIELGLKEKRYRLLVENQNDSIVTFDRNLCLQYVSPNFCNIFGIKEKDILGKNFFPLIHGDDVEVVRASIATLKNPPYSTYHEERDKTVDGWRWFGWSLKASFDNEGNMLETVGVGRDITKQKEAEKRLRFLSTIAEQVTDSIVVTDTDFRITYVNSAAQSLFGYADEELIGRTPDILNAEPTSKQIQEELYRVVSSGESYTGEGLNKRKDGTTFICAYKVSPMRNESGEIDGYVGTQCDITEKHQAKETLQKYRELVENANSIILRWIPDGTITFFNEFAQKFFGFDASEIIGKNIIGSIVPEKESTGRDLKQMVADILEDPAKYEQNENENICKKGKRVWVNWTNRAIQDQNGDIIEILNVGTDITDRKQAEEKLRQSEERLIKEVDERKKTSNYLKNIIETSLSGIVVTDSKGNISRTNDAYLNMLGYEKGELVGKHTIELSPREAGLYESSTGKKIQIGEDFLNSSRKMVENLLKQGKVKKYEGYALRKDGKLIFTEENNVLVYNEQREIIAAFSNIQDITDRKTSEEEREKLFAELQKSLEEVKTLEGIIPICMHCKGIRDDKGAWNKLEKFITEHSDAQFSHGICDECLKKYYPEEYEELHKP